MPPGPPSGAQLSVAMIYTPETLDEVDVAVQLVVNAYNYVTGSNLDPTSFG